MIREDRDLAFWTSIYEHPQVKPHVSLGHELDLSAFVESAAVLPLRAEHGGFFFIRLDPDGRAYELHTLFSPEGWGREALIAAKEAFLEVFRQGAEIIFTSEVRGNRRSQPPLSFRFERRGEFTRNLDLGADLRPWSLTRAAWEASPARRRM